MSLQDPRYSSDLADWQRREAAGDFAWHEQEVREQEKLHDPRDQVLSSIHSKQARELVQEVYRAVRRPVPWMNNDWDYMELQAVKDEDAYHYRDWLRGKLEGSNLAMLLPGGLEALPNIYEAMPEPWSSIERLSRPKSYKQMIRHVISHLDWYVDPSRKVKLPVWHLSWLAAVVVTIIFVALNMHFGWHLQNFAFWMIPSLTGTIAVLLSRLTGGHQLGERKLHKFHKDRLLINGAELFYYLSRSYADHTSRRSDIKFLVGD